ncbi:hypothetical protein HYFRA_00005038 [Hymenoscyphus fraxineus]|uniref:Uncharacterized protein n=1 Tax=Hymenoscyphus fraxineus TaxID=746836 RepID=A0A9N9KKK0_9HELO|nr:hypothetical protein HYFRA_00005038 [Hymenoscyphus fraxineus]
MSDSSSWYTSLNSSFGDMVKPPTEFEWVWCINNFTFKSHSPEPGDIYYLERRVSNTNFTTG